jgi:hypothetical protein
MPKERVAPPHGFLKPACSFAGDRSIGALDKAVALRAAGCRPQGM